MLHPLLLHKDPNITLGVHEGVVSHARLQKFYFPYRKCKIRILRHRKMQIVGGEGAKLLKGSRNLPFQYGHGLIQLDYPSTIEQPK